jgi:hypothetical protein
MIPKPPLRLIGEIGAILHHNRERLHLHQREVAEQIEDLFQCGFTTMDYRWLETTGKGLRTVMIVPVLVKMGLIKWSDLERLVEKYLKEVPLEDRKWLASRGEPGAKVGKGTTFMVLKKKKQKPPNRGVNPILPDGRRKRGRPRKNALPARPEEIINYGSNHEEPDYGDAGQ